MEGVSPIRGGSFKRGRCAICTSVQVTRPETGVESKGERQITEVSVLSCNDFSKFYLFTSSEREQHSQQDGVSVLQSSPAEVTDTCTPPGPAALPRALSVAVCAVSVVTAEVQTQLWRVSLLPVLCVGLLHLGAALGSGGPAYRGYVLCLPWQ